MQTSIDLLIVCMALQIYFAPKDVGYLYFPAYHQVMPFLTMRLTYK